MTPEQLALVQSSCACLEAQDGRLAALAVAFYERLFARDSELRTLFTADLETQQTKFVTQLGVIIRSLTDLDDFLEEVRALGARHAMYGARFADYATVGSALLDSLADVLREGFDAASREAWSLAYNMIAETMLEGAQALGSRYPSGGPSWCPSTGSKTST